MNDENRKFLDRLLSISSPTGNEQKLQRFLHDWAKDFADTVETDLHGNLAVVINPKGKLRIMLAGHCDQLAFMVMGITEQGYLKIDPLGGIDEATVLGSRVVVHAKDGNIPGVFGKVSTHLQSKEEQDAVPMLDKVWVDIGARDRKEAESKVQIGDYITYEPVITELMGGRITAPKLDNMLGLYAVMQTAKRCKERGIDVALYAVSTVQEEIGSRGADSATTAISPHVAIAVDTTLATDTPGKINKATAPKIALGAGPSISHGPNTNILLEHLCVEACIRLEIPFQKHATAKAESNDAKNLQLADGGTAAASIGIPIRNMHTQVEIASLEDIENTARLLTELVCSIRPEMDFLPINADPHQREVSSGITQVGLGLQREKLS